MAYRHRAEVTTPALQPYIGLATSIKLDYRCLNFATQLWSFRPSTLTRLRLTNQASAECNNLFTVLNAIPALVSTQGTGLTSSALHSPMSASPQLAPSPVTMHAPLPPSTPTRRPRPFLHTSRQLTRTPMLKLPHGAPDMLSAYPFELSVLRVCVWYWAGDVRGTSTPWRGWW